MEIRIQKETSVSIHDQLVTQISMQIVSGLLATGAKLPSIRALSSKLDIHHNTCLSAYRSLSEGGLIEIRQGSGARVKTLTLSPQSAIPGKTDLQTLADFFAKEAHQRGFDWTDALKALKALNKSHEKLISTTRQFVFVDAYPDILPVFQAELEQALDTPIQTASLDALGLEKHATSHFIVSRYHYNTLHEKLNAEGIITSNGGPQITIVELNAGQNELSLVRQLPEGTMIVVISASSIILRQSEAVIRALRGEEVLIRSVLFGSEPMDEVSHLLSRAKVIFADAYCLPKLNALNPRKLQPIEAITAVEKQKLKQSLGNY